jgi:ribosomal protein S27AE
MFPVSCKTCGEVTSANFKKQPLQCERCGATDVAPFTAPGMSKGDGKYNAEIWGELRLDDGHYRCPKCNGFGLQFAKGLGMMSD